MAFDRTTAITANTTIGTDTDVDTSGAQVIDTITLTDGVVVSAITTRDLTASDIGAQAADSDLTAIAGLTSAADKGIQFTGSGAAATYDLTTAGKALIDDADASAQRTTLGLAIGTNVMAHAANNAVLSATQAWTLPQRAALLTDNDGSFDLDAKQNFFCTPGTAVALTFANPADGQSGYVKLVNAGAYVHTAHGNTKIHADDLTAIGAAGTFLLGYLSDGTNTWVTVSKVLA